jgi:hypothetical protein
MKGRIFSVINCNGFSPIIQIEKIIVKKEAIIAGTKVKSFVNLAFRENNPRRDPATYSTIIISNNNMLSIISITKNNYSIKIENL